MTSQRVPVVALRAVVGAMLLLLLDNKLAAACIDCYGEMQMVKQYPSAENGWRTVTWCPVCFARWEWTTFTLARALGVDG